MIVLFVVAVLWYLFVCYSSESSHSDKPIAYLAAFVIVGCLIIWGAL